MVIRSSRKSDPRRSQKALIKKDRIIQLDLAFSLVAAAPQTEVSEWVWWVFVFVFCRCFVVFFYLFIAFVFGFERDDEIWERNVGGMNVVVVSLHQQSTIEEILCLFLASVNA